MMRVKYRHDALAEFQTLSAMAPAENTNHEDTHPGYSLKLELFTQKGVKSVLTEYNVLYADASSMVEQFSLSCIRLSGEQTSAL
jgi:hypothetical protein